MRRPARFLLLLAPAVLLVLAGCTGTAAPSPTSSSATADGSDADTSSPVDTTVYPVPAGVAVDYQLGGSYDPPTSVGIVVRDSTAVPLEAVYSVCYINAFQTQPQDAAIWTSQRSDLLLKTSTGSFLIDKDWPDEMILDTSTAAKRTELAAIVGDTIQLCKDDNFDAVEFDNLDSWTRSKGALTQQDNLDFATLLVAKAHSVGLAAAQKNSAELGTAGRDTAKFDFAITEECDAYSECAAFTKVYGDRVIDIEYTDNLRDTFAKTCARSTTPVMTVLRDRDLHTPGDKGYVYKHC